MKRLHRNVRGTTLIELVIVGVIISVVSAMAIPSWLDYMPKMRAKAAVRDAVSALREARSLAVTEKKLYGVFFDITNGQFILFEDRANPGLGTYETGDSLVTTTRLNSDIQLGYSTFANNAVVFDMNGAASTSGNVTFTASHSQQIYTVDVLAATGRVKMTES